MENTNIEKILFTPLWEYWNDDTQLETHDRYITESEEKNKEHMNSEIRKLLTIKRSFLNKYPVNYYLIKNKFKRYKQVFLYDDFLLRYFKTRSYDDIKYLKSIAYKDYEEYFTLINTLNEEAVRHRLESINFVLEFICTPIETLLEKGDKYDINKIMNSLGTCIETSLFKTKYDMLQLHIYYTEIVRKSTSFNRVATKILLDFYSERRTEEGSGLGSLVTEYILRQLYPNHLLNLVKFLKDKYTYYFIEGTKPTEYDKYKYYILLDIADLWLISSETLYKNKIFNIHNSIMLYKLQNDPNLEKALEECKSYPTADSVREKIRRPWWGLLIPLIYLIQIFLLVQNITIWEINTNHFLVFLSAFTMGIQIPFFLAILTRIGFVIESFQHGQMWWAFILFVQGCWGYRTFQDETHKFLRFYSAVCAGIGSLFMLLIYKFSDQYLL